MKRLTTLLLSGLLVGLFSVAGCSNDGAPSAQDGPGSGDGLLGHDGGQDGGAGSENGPGTDGPQKGCGGGCKTPPKTRCLDGSKLRVYESEGFCENEVCNYGFHDETCTDGCEAAACKGSPCQGVTCDQPPAASCVDGNTLQVYESPGTCDQGQCIYQKKTIPCASGCEANACKGDPCAGVTCNAPPKNLCADAMTLRSYEGQGTCSGGNCSYKQSDTTCSFGCELGACKGDPCAGKSCNAPPASFCADANTLRSFASPGSCAGGSCTYASSDTTCPFGCAAGSCKGDPCAGKSCTTPPASYCPDVNTLRSFASPGSCAGGSCTYTPTDTPCSFGCDQGACKNDPCAGKTCNTPPATTCKDASTLRSYATVGVCQNGSCGYTPTDTPCVHGCALGQCLPDPCASVSCTSPPAGGCISGTTLRTFADPGLCDKGACSYAYSDQLCPGGCSGGVCSGPTCGGTVCNAPPADTCSSAKILASYAKIGTCSTSNACQYQQINIECSEGCFNGACIAGSRTLEWVPLSKNLGYIAYALDGSGGSHILGCDYGLYYRHKTLSGWVDEEIEAGSGFCGAGAMVVDAQGRVHLAYRDTTNKDLRYALWDGGALTRELVATSGDMGYGVDLTLDASGKPVIAYLGENGGTHSVYLATRGGSGWQSSIVHSQASTIFSGPELQIAANGDWHVLYGYPVAYQLRQGTTWTAQAVPANARKAGRSLLRRSSGERTLLYENNAQTTYLRHYDAQGQTSDERIAKTGSYPPFAILHRFWPPSLVTSQITEYVKTNLDLWDKRPLLGGGFSQYASLKDARVGGDKRVRALFTVSGTYTVVTEPACTPSCGLGACGSDGCGGSCGTCGAGTTCSPDNTCSAWRFEQVAEIPYNNSHTDILPSGSELHVLDSNHHYHYKNGVWKLIAPPYPSGDPHAGFVDASGVLHVAWYTSPSYYGGPIQLATFQNGAWSTPKSVGVNGYGGIAIYVDAAGVYHLFHSQRPATYTYTFLYTTFDGTTATSQTITSTTASDVRVVRDASSKWHVTWRDYSSLRYSTDATGSWVSSVVDADMSSYSPHGPQLFADAQGVLHVCYWDNTAHKPAYARKNGASWDKEFIPGTSGAYCAMSSSGAIVAVDMSTLYTRQSASNWTSEPLPLGSYAVIRGAVAYDASGKLHLFQQFYLGGYYYRYHAER